MQLRPYQRSAVDATWNFLRARTDNPCVVLPTGAGKTIVLAELIREALTSWPGTRILVLAHVRELVGQNHDKLMAYWPAAPAGIYSASLKRRDRFNAVIFASIQSVAGKAMQLGRFDLLLIDEAHRIPLKNDGQYREFIDACLAINPNLRIAGLTATPYRLGGGQVCGPKNILNEAAYEASIRELIQDGYLSRLVSKAGVSRGDWSAVKVNGGEYVGSQLEAAVNRPAVVESACDEIVTYCHDRRAWIVFCAGVSHAEHVTAALRARGVACDQVDGKTPPGDRDARISAFQRGELRALVNVNVLSEGFDATHVDAVVMMRPTMSAAMYYQQAGRGMRLHPGKANCLVLDFAGNIEAHGPVDAIRPPKKPGEKASSSAPVRECPKCHAFMPVQTRTCECGFEFLIIDSGPSHDATASDLAILSEDVPAYQPTELAVTRVAYGKHEKHGRPDSLVVTYYCGLRMFREWILLQHGGPRRAQACVWWKMRSREIDKDTDEPVVPRTVDEALLIARRLAEPLQIAVDERGKYPEILAYDFG